jgi:hypothetical protein
MLQLPHSSERRLQDKRVLKPERMLLGAPEGNSEV